MNFIRDSRLLLLVAGLVLAGTILFAWFTQHAWEDYYITLRSSRNLVEGNGLVFNPGERVHTFTSPLGVLVPAACTWIVGEGREDAALWLFRLFNAGLLSAAAIWAWRRFDSIGLGHPARAVFYLLAFADSKLVDFSINGMETAMLIAFTVWLWSELERSPFPRSWAVAVGCGGLMWTRPDAFILGAALLIPHWVFRQSSGAGTGASWRRVVMGVLLGGLLYLPWFVWAWWYYGSPVPHTIIAKSQVAQFADTAAILLTPWRSLMGDSLLKHIYLPSYWGLGGWPAWLSGWAYVLSVTASMAWLIRGLPATARRSSLTLFLGSFYICAIIFFPWYSPPWTVVGALVLAGLIDWSTKALERHKRPRLGATVRIAAMAMASVQLFVLAFSAWGIRVQQRVIEDGIRREIGLWLRQNSRPGDSVFMECLGYIGYFSGLKTYDYPGLSSPEVVAAIRAGDRRFTEVIGRIKPSWLVVRPFEIADASKPENAAWLDYELVKEWDARAALDAVPVLPGRGWMEFDAQFLVFRRKQPAGLH